MLLLVKKLDADRLQQGRASVTGFGGNSLVDGGKKFNREAVSLVSKNTSNSNLPVLLNTQIQKQGRSRLSNSHTALSLFRMRPWTVLVCALGALLRGL